MSQGKRWVGSIFFFHNIEIFDRFCTYFRPRGAKIWILYIHKNISILYYFIKELIPLTIN